ncbi:MAG TPA: replicative DNA helicase [Blastocatellia bacterium]|nr:replicative DNA helicase [Blastocatellia bacterium]
MSQQRGIQDPFFEKGLPSNPEAERSILGAILLDNTVCNQAIELLRREDFFLDSHRRIYDKMVALTERGMPIDLITLTDELRRAAEFEQIGGATYIASLIDGVPRTDTIEHYAKIVKQKAMLRRLITASNQIIARAFDEEDDPDIIIDQAEQMIFQIAEDRVRQGFQYIGDVAQRRLEQIEQMAGRPEMITGVPTGFTDFDQMTSGLQRQDLIIIAARPSMGKCVVNTTEIILTDGRIATIEEIYRARKASLLTLRDDFTFAPATPSDFIDDGVKPVFRVATKLGRAVECTLTHPFLTIDGWLPLAELKCGDKVAVPRKLAVFGEAQMRECEIKLLAYLIGDGCIRKGPLEFTSTNPVLRDDFEQATAEFGGTAVTPRKRDQRVIGLRVRRSEPRISKRNPLRTWLEKLGIYGKNSHQKFIPAPVFTLKRDLLALFLNRLFATDGWACVLASGPVQLGYATVSEKLARQVQHLLLRFGVIAKLKRRSVKYKDERRGAWQLDITDALSIKTFISEIGIFGKEEVLERALEALESKKYQSNCDLIPTAVWDQIAIAKGDESWSHLSRRAGIKGHTNIHVRRRQPTRQRLQTLATALHDEQLYNLATSEIYWDEITSIEFVGDKQVYDLTIPETHNFVANDICVHNTALALNMAQYAAKNGHTIGIFSLEMSAEQLVSRLLCSEARVDAHRLRTGYLNREEWARLADALRRLTETQIYIDDTAGAGVLEMRAKTRRLKAERGLDMLIIDYLQLMSGRGRIESRQQEVSQISRDLKGLAKELDVPVIALSQLSRAPEQRSEHKPQLSDLRESGAIEQDADVVSFIFREEVYNQTEENRGKAELIVAKQRNGPTGSVEIAFLKEFTRFENMWKE